MKLKTGIVWFRQDLRLNDNEALHEALASVDVIIPVYIFDIRLFQEVSSYGFKRINNKRAQFIIESINDLRNNIETYNGELIIRIGIPEEEIFRIAKEYRTSWVFCNRERTANEVEIQDRLEHKLWSIGQEIRYSRGKMLYYTSDLPFPVTQTPDMFSAFRKEVEKITPVRQPLPVPNLKGRFFGQEIAAGVIPSLNHLGFKENLKSNGSLPLFPGGETEALKRLKYYVWDQSLINTYKETRNAMVGKDYSSRLSPYLALGCISPKTIYHEVKKYEAVRVKNESTYCLVYELLWRDFFRLMAKKHGNAIFKKGGIKNKFRDDLSDNRALLKLWCEGLTGFPFIDACMIELNSTGFLSNRGRQNVASFLVNDLKINWQMGAEYFEGKLIDYDPASNWGNWNYIAGVGSDPRSSRNFGALNQARKYDPHGEFVKRWIPALRNIPDPYFHTPFLLSPEDQTNYGIRIGIDYPAPIVQLDHS